MGKQTSYCTVTAGRSLALLAALLAALLFLGLPTRSAAQSNPFFNTPAPVASSISIPTPRLQALIDAQRMLRAVLAEAVDRSASGGAGILALLGLAFAYGLLHALGPGHRKIALAAYFIARPARPIQGVTAGISVAILHAAAAMVAIYGLYYLFKRTVTVAFSSVSSILELASYAAITLLGLILLFLAVRSTVRVERTNDAACCSGAQSSERKTLTAIIVGSGVVPCPGTALVLIFCLSQDLPSIGALASLAMSLGMAVITVSVSLAAIFGKRGLLSALPRGSRLNSLLHHGLEIGGAALIVAFGLFMLSPYLAGLLVLAG
jgi:ABC-type nickel/cobalt efflux system permease component RcnA